MGSDIIYIADMLKKYDPNIIVHTTDAKHIIKAEPLIELQTEWKDSVLYIAQESILPPENLTFSVNILYSGCNRPAYQADSYRNLNYISTVAPIPPAVIIDAVEQINILNGKYAQIMGNLIDALSKRQGLQCIVNYGYELFGNPLTIYDLSYKLLAVSSPYCELPDSPFQTPYFQKTLESGYLQPKSIEIGIRSKRFEKITVSSDPVFTDRFLLENDEDLSVPPYGYWDIGIQIQGITVAYMSVTGVDSPFCVCAAEWLASLEKLASIELQKSDDFIHSSGMEYEALLTSLLEKKISDPVLVDWRMHLLNINLGSNLCVVTIFPKDTESKEHGITQLLQSHLRALFHKCLSLRYRGNIVLLVSCVSEQEPLSAKETQRLQHFLKPNHLCCGISNVFHAITEMSEFYQQTILAHRYGIKTDVSKIIYYYNEYSIFRIFSHCEKESNLREFCHPGILHLWEDNKPGNQELLRTLYLYLYHMKDIQTVSEELHIHRNTLFYRLNRIKSIINDDIDNSDSLFRILLSFELLKYFTMCKGETASFALQNVSPPQDRKKQSNASDEKMER